MNKHPVMLDDEDDVVMFEFGELPPIVPVSDTYPVKTKKERVMKNTGKKRVMATNKGVEYTSIQDKALAQAVNLLYAIRAEFCIVMPDGEPVKSSGYDTVKAQTARLPYGSIASHFKPYLEPMQVGDTATVPFKDDINHSKMQSAMCAWMVGNWGKGSYTTLVSRKEKTIQVLRVK